MRSRVLRPFFTLLFGDIKEKDNCSDLSRGSEEWRAFREDFSPCSGIKPSVLCSNLYSQNEPWRWSVIRSTTSTWNYVPKITLLWAHCFMDNLFLLLPAKNLLVPRDLCPVSTAELGVLTPWSWPIRILWLSKETKVRCKCNQFV